MLHLGLLHVTVVLGNRGLVLSPMHLRSDKGFETRVIESFKLANSKGFLTVFSRCKGRVASTTYNYGYLKYIAVATTICRKCQYQIPNAESTKGTWSNALSRSGQLPSHALITSRLHQPSSKSFDPRS